jgi:hypothetical protein
MKNKVKYYIEKKISSLIGISLILIITYISSVFLIRSYFLYVSYCFGNTLEYIIQRHFCHIIYHNITSTIISFAFLFITLVLYFLKNPTYLVLSYVLLSTSVLLLMGRKGTVCWKGFEFD